MSVDPRLPAWPRVRLGALCFALACVGGGDKLDETGDTGPPPCPYDVASFCAYEFGGDCPTYEEAAAMSCDGYHFDPTGTTGAAPNTTDGHEECRYPIVSCHDASDSNIRTRIYFESSGPGEIHMVDLIWEDEPVCNINAVLSEDTVDCR